MAPPDAFEADTNSVSNLAPTRRGNPNNRLLLGLIVIIGLVGIVAIVFAAIALSKTKSAQVINVAGSSGQSAGGAPVVINNGGSGGGGYSSGRTWSIATGHDWGAHEYFDKKGYIRGFSKEFIQAVCSAGNMDCNPVWAPYTQCWTSTPGQHAMGGEGLMDSWFDACIGYVATPERIHTFSFGIPYLKTIPSRFHKKKGSTFDPYDLRGKKIGFHTGYSDDEKCLARAESSTLKNYLLTADQIIYRDTPEILVPMLIEGKIDAIFAKILSTEKHFDNIEQLKEPAIDCGLGGNTMMTRKDSGFLAEWNRAFTNLRASGGFKKLCQEAEKRHELHGSIMCVD